MPPRARARSLAAAVVFGVLRPRGVRAKPAGAKPVRQPRHHPLHLLPARKRAVQVPLRHGFPGIAGQAAEPPVEHTVRRLLHGRRMLQRLDAGRGLRANPPDPLRSHHRHRPVATCDRRGAYGRLSRIAHQQGAPSLAQCVLRSERSAVHRCRAHPLARLSGAGQPLRRRSPAQDVRPHHVPKRHHLPQSRSSQPGDRDIMLGHAEIIRERTLFEYQGNSVYRRQAKATNV